MLKTKLDWLIEKISLPSKTKRQRLLIYAVTLLLLAGIGYVIYTRVTADSEAQKKVKIRDEAGSLLADDKYSDAAKKLEETYKKDTDDVSKAYDAFNIGQAYQSALNYDAAIYWYNKALVAYRGSGDKDGQAETIQAISNAKKFKESQGKTPASSPVDKGN